jgi:hypothetical protein
METNEVFSRNIYFPIALTITTKNSRFLDGFKPSRNGKKPFGTKSKRFILDGLKPSRKMDKKFGLWRYGKIV